SAEERGKGIRGRGLRTAGLARRGGDPPCRQVVLHGASHEEGGTALMTPDVEGEEAHGLGPFVLGAGGWTAVDAPSIQQPFVAGRWVRAESDDPAGMTQPAARDRVISSGNVPGCLD